MAAPPEPTARPTAAPLGGRVAAAFVALGAATTVQSYLNPRIGGGSEVTLVRAAQLALPFWLLWAAASPVVVAAARRVPIARARLARRLGFHAAVALALSVAVAGPLYASQRLFGLADWAAPPWWQATAAVALWRLGMSLLVYAALCGLVQASDASARLAAERRDADRLARELAEARLHALRMQLHPHFLFNAMNSAAMLVRRGDRAEAVRVLALLGELTRAVLDDARGGEVPLREEIALLERYLAIERVRFQDRLTVAIDVADEALDVPVPTLILQPLVENALRHGIARRADAGRVEVRARRDGGRLLVQVCDDGAGPPAAPDAVGDAAGGLGLRNTRERLARRYGGAARFELRGAPGRGAVASIELPAAGGGAA